MYKTSSRIALVPAGAAASPHHAQAQPPAEAAQARRRRAAALAVACLLRVAVIALLAHDIAPSAWRARHDPVELAVVGGPSALLAAVFVCIHRAERLSLGSPTGERRRLHVSVWVLSAPLLCLVAYQLSRTMPAATVIAIWSFTSFLVLAGFYMLVLHQEQQYQDLDGVDSDADAAAAGDGDDDAFKTARPTDGLV